jgi:steroid delta-isomerase-like uncharacterized protein
MSNTRTVLEELFRRAGVQDLAAVLELWHPEGVLDDATLGRTMHGKTEVTAYLEEFFAACADLTYAPERLVVEGSTGVVVWSSSTRLHHPFFGFPASQEVLELRGVDVFEIRDDLIAHESSWYGDMWLGSQLSSGTDAPGRVAQR